MSIVLVIASKEGFEAHVERMIAKAQRVVRKPGEVLVDDTRYVHVTSLKQMLGFHPDAIVMAHGGTDLPEYAEMRRYADVNTSQTRGSWAQYGER